MHILCDKFEAMAEALMGVSLTDAMEVVKLLKGVGVMEIHGFIVSLLPRVLFMDNSTEAPITPLLLFVLLLMLLLHTILTVS